MSEPSEKEALRLLVQHVARAFYDAKHIVILDQLARHTLLKDDDLSGRIGLQLKELNKLMAELCNDKLVKVYRQNELKEGQMRAVGRSYYFIDYEHFCNVVKWRVAEMRRIIDSKLRNELDNKGYICPQCKAKFVPLDADRIFDPMRNGMFCNVCDHEVIDNEDSDNVKGSQDKMQRFNAQMKWIREGLKKSEDMVIPAMDVPTLVKKQLEANAAIAAGGDGLAIAGADGKKTEQNLTVELTGDKDDETRRLERERAAEAKRQQNALPAWHLRSTVSGDLTALGVANAPSANSQAVSNPGSQANGVETKPSVEVMNYYDQYYASLNAMTPNDSSHGNTPPMWPEEEQKYDPSGWNSTGKRRRDDDEMDGRQSKLSRHGPTGYPSYSRQGSDSGSSLGSGFHLQPPSVAVSAGVSPAQSYQGDDFDDAGANDKMAGVDAIVYVNGVAVPLSEVTEEHQDQMTPEEYTQYFEILQAQG